nr:MAG TPA: hypothetical protein [Caudoviricetes sp.]
MSRLYNQIRSNQGYLRCLMVAVGNNNLFQRVTRDNGYPLFAVGNSHFSISCGGYLCRTMP